jgi:crotonobetainyl-CoA:carnitine CoA-transferase CaiB-like acyl-CoA transferase
MGALDGIKVLELAEHGFVPSCGAVLADWGADVVKVERPTGDPLRMVQKAGLVADTGDFNFLWEQMNRNKRGVSLDLSNPESQPVLAKLVEWADVSITSFLPAVRRKLHTDVEDFWAINPRLVYARGHGQGQRGEGADEGGFDSVSYWARGGIAHMLTPPGGPLVMQRAAMGDGPSGALLAGGVAAALVQQARTGKGVLVDTALLGSAIWALAPDLVTTTITGENPAPINMSKAMSNPLIGTYKTRDERWVMLNMMNDTRHWPEVCRALGLDALLDDPAYSDTAGRAEHRDVLHQAIADAVAGITIDGLRERMNAHDTVWSLFNAPTEVVVDPQVLANGYLPQHPDHATARLAAAPVQHDNELPSIRRHAPGTGEHTDEILGSLGIDTDEIARLRSVGAVA